MDIPESRFLAEARKLGKRCQLVNVHRLQRAVADALHYTEARVDKTEFGEKQMIFLSVGAGNYYFQRGATCALGYVKTTLGPRVRNDSLAPSGT